MRKNHFPPGLHPSPDPAGEAYSALPDPLVVFKGPTAKGGMEGENGGKRRESLKGGKRRGQSLKYFSLEPFEFRITHHRIISVLFSIAFVLS